MISKDYQGATLNGKHTFDDYKMIIGNTDIVSMPKPKTIYIDVPGSSKRIDLSESLTGMVEYENRVLKLVLGSTNHPMKWPKIVSNLMDELLGKKVRVILDIDPSFYYEGRCEQIEFNRTGSLGEIELLIDAQPFKMDITSSAEDWLWDSFSFEEGIIREYMDILVFNNKVQEVKGYPYPQVPIFHVSNISDSAMVYSSINSKFFNLQNGENRFAELKIGEKGDTLIFYGNFTVSVELRGRYL